MPQWRKLHTKAIDSLDINDMPDDFTRLFWLLLPLVLDSAGRILDNANFIRSKTFPLRQDVTNRQVANALDWFARRGMIARYEVDGRHYLYATKFAEHQGNTSKEAASNYPPPPQVFQYNSRPTPDLLQSKSGTDADADADADADMTPRSEIAGESASGADAPSPLTLPPPDINWPNLNEFVEPVSVSGPEKPKRPRRSAPREPPPPAIQVFHANTQRYPARALWSDIDTAIGRDPPELERWAQVIRGWLGMGWNKGNVNGMLEFFRRNEIPRGGNDSGRTGRYTGPSWARRDTGPTCEDIERILAERETRDGLPEVLGGGVHSSPGKAG